MNSRFLLIGCHLAVLGCIVGSCADAQDLRGDPLRFVRWTVADVSAAAGAAVTPRVLLATGAAAGTVLLLSRVDESLTSNARSLAKRTPRRLRRVMHEAGNVQIVRPMAIVLFLGSLTSGDEKFQDAAFTSLQAIVLSNLVTNGLKLAVGRARPRDGLGPGSVSPFSGRRSFPSGHATTAFAFTMPWLLFYPGPATYVLSGLAAGTAIVRMVDDYHWFTDVLAVAAIGTWAGYRLAKRHGQGRSRVQIVPVVVHGKVGVKALISLRPGRSA